MTPVIILTRPAPDADRFAAELTARLPAPRIVISPVISIENADGLPPMGGVRGVIFTSRNAVRAYRDNGGPSLPCYCVGQVTALAARAMGMAVQAVAVDAKTLVQQVLADRPAGLWIHVHGEHLRVDMSAMLLRDGINAQGHLIYRQIAQPISELARTCLRGTDPVILPVFSPRSGKLLAGDAQPTAPTYIVAMSAAVAREFDDWPQMTCVIAKSPDSTSMLDAVETVWRSVVRVEGGGDAK